MIKAENLSVSFGERQIFKILNMIIPKNKITVLLGTNGAGKTTLLKTFAGIIKTKNNQILNSFKEIFYLPQRPHCPSNITLFDYISLSFFKNSFKWFINSVEKQKITDVLISLNLYEKKDIFVEKLSSGEFQLANIALALISNADCILFDEPTSNMDLINQTKV
ncbi:MAG: ATP-binding cassette domain-containing protein, partial [Candidatus Gastranaerophilaceae bacterium]